MATGEVDLAGDDPGKVDAALARLPGFGPWTRAYIAMRALGDPDAIPIGDLGLRRAMERLGEPADPRSLARARRGVASLACLRRPPSLDHPRAPDLRRPRAGAADSPPDPLEITP